MAAFEPPRDNEHRVDCTRAATVEYARQVIDRFKRNDSNVALPTCNKFGYLQFCIKSGMQYAVWVKFLLLCNWPELGKLLAQM